MDSQHIHCPGCGDVVGIWADDLSFLAERDNVYPMIRCRGKGNHQHPREMPVHTHWSMVEEFFLYYPETSTQEHAYAYIGPPWWPLLVFVLLFVVERNPHEYFKRIRVSGKVLVWLPQSKQFWKEIRNIFSTPFD